MATFSNRQMSVPVPVEFINKYMINANATYVKVYLYGLAKCCEPEADVTNASIAEALDILETDVTKAWRYWKKVGLVSAVGKDRLIFEPVIADAADLPKKKAVDEAAASAPAEEKPQHKRATMSDVSAAMKINPQIKDTITMAEQILKKTLSQREITAIYNYMDWYGMSGELVLSLLEYCVSIEKTGFAYIDKVAESWHEQGIDFAAAGKIINRAAKENRMQNKCKKIFGIDRALSTSEAKYISSWVSELNMSETMIKAAFERTVNNTGKLSLPYMNTILRSWHDKGIKTAAQLEQKDPAKPSVRKNAHQGSYELDDMAAIERRLRLEKQKNRM